jgi:hypothetical protein
VIAHRGRQRALGTPLARYLERLGLTAGAFAARLGIHRVTVQKWSTGCPVGLLSARGVWSVDPRAPLLVGGRWLTYLGPVRRRS